MLGVMRMFYVSSRHSTAKSNSVTCVISGTVCNPNQLKRAEQAQTCTEQLQMQAAPPQMPPPVRDRLTVCCSDTIRVPSGSGQAGRIPLNI
jgi:hypothetical protein